MSSLLSTGQVAKRLKISTARVRKFRAEGRLSPAHIVGSEQAVYAESEIERFAALERPAHRPKMSTESTSSGTKPRKSFRPKSNKAKRLRITSKKSSPGTR